MAVRDLSVTAQWFSSVFGCVLHEVDPGNWIYAVHGDVTFMLGHCPDAIPVDQIGDHGYVAYVVVDDISPLVSRARSENAEILAGPTVQSWGRIEAVLRTPDGHRIVVGQ